MSDLAQGRPNPSSGPIGQNLLEILSKSPTSGFWNDKIKILSNRRAPAPLCFPGLLVLPGLSGRHSAQGLGLVLCLSFGLPWWGAVLVARGPPPPPPCSFAWVVRRPPLLAASPALRSRLVRRVAGWFCAPLPTAPAGKGYGFGWCLYAIPCAASRAHPAQM